LGGHALKEEGAIIDSYSYESKANFLLIEGEGVLFGNGYKKCVKFI
jgi:hypothetical protein